jgi:hypothetical protein
MTMKRACGNPIYSTLQMLTWFVALATACGWFGR